MKRRLLRYRAGPGALRRLRREGLRAEDVRAVIGPASGPKWLVLAGLDRALLASGLLAGGRRLLVGASAGAWRMMAYACRDPEAAHRRFLDGYLEQSFTLRDTHRTIGAAYRRMLADLFADEATGLVEHPVYDLALHTARARFARSRWGLIGSLAGAMAADLVSAGGLGVFFERILFHNRPGRFRQSSAGSAFAGRIAPLTRTNLLAAAAATGAVPLQLESVLDPSGAPAGLYVDGGLTDYHLNQRFCDPGDGVVLFPHYRRAIVGQWLDKRRRSRTVPEEVTDNLLQLYPSPEFVASLPGSQLPDRQDFTVLVDRPAERIARWRSVAADSEVLGEEFLDDLESGRLADRVEPF